MKACLKSGRRTFKANMNPSPFPRLRIYEQALYSTVLPGCRIYIYIYFTVDT
jgi:hypothetical protein